MLRKRVRVRQYRLRLRQWDQHHLGQRQLGQAPQLHRQPKAGTVTPGLLVRGPANPTATVNGGDVAACRVLHRGVFFFLLHDRCRTQHDAHIMYRLQKRSNQSWQDTWEYNNMIRCAYSSLAASIEFRDRANRLARQDFFYLYMCCHILLYQFLSIY
jgi:hypothetical protein